MSRNWDRLRQLSLDELRVRSSQRLNSLLERRGWSSLVKLPSDQAFWQLFKASPKLKFESAAQVLEYFRTRSAPEFFPGLLNRDETIRTLKVTWPRAEKQIVENAAAIIAGNFDLLGWRDLRFGDPIDWQLEPVSGKRAQLVHWSRLNYLDAGVFGDKKIVWELNRHQYFVTLGQAYWLTGDERYAQTFAAHLNSWMDQNPPKMGINWASSLEVAFRSISWLWALYFFRDSPSLNASTLQRTLRFLYLNARHLETYLSTYFSPNTHLTGEALGLFYLGTLLPEFPAAARWRARSGRILLDQMPRQIRPDGVYFEQSSYYHRYTTDFYIHFLILSRLNQQAVPAEVERNVKLLLDHLMHITGPEGTTPHFGDDDGGRLITLDRRPTTDFRATLATGAALFHSGEYKFVAAEPAEETLWLLGPAGLADFNRVAAQEPPAKSVEFNSGGYYVMRDAWTPEANYLLIDCGPHGMQNCGHAHADALSFVLAARGRNMLVDPGTFTYTGSREKRDWFRSSMAHNTLTVDGQSSSMPAGPFSWSTIAKCRALSWITSARFDYFEGTHDGYESLSPPVTHRRGILFLKNDYWIVRDRARCQGLHAYDLWFHLAPETECALQEREGAAATVRATNGAECLDIAAFGGNAVWTKQDGEVSRGYGESVPAPVYAFSTSGANEDLFTFLLPRASSVQARSVREVEAIGGHAFEVVGESAHDIVMIKADHRVEMARLASDFAWTWARFSDETATVPDQLVLIDGHWLELEGREVLRSERRINYLVANRAGNQFRIETDEGALNLTLPIRDFESAFSNLKSHVRD
jgi:hypothetical protein